MTASAGQRGVGVLLAISLLGASTSCSFLLQTPARPAPHGSYPRCEPSPVPAAWDFLAAAAGIAAGVGAMNDQGESDDVSAEALLVGGLFLASGIYGTVSSYQCNAYRNEALKHIPTDILTVGAAAPPVTDPVPEIPGVPPPAAAEPVPSPPTPVTPKSEPAPAEP